MAFDFPGRDQLVEIIPSGVKISNLTELLDETRPVRASEMEWRWAILDIAHNAMVSPRSHHTGPAKSVFQTEARWRASAFLKLALLDSQVPAGYAYKSGSSKWDSAGPRHLLRLYRGLCAACNDHPADAAHHLNTIVNKLISTYSPVVDIADISVKISRILLTPLRGHALVLSAGLLVQGFLQRACISGLAGRLHVSLIRRPDETYRLTIHISEETSVVLSSDSLGIALRLLGACQAEFVCSDTAQGGSAIDISFNADTISAS